ncbi:hypothetical protein Ait01nite_082240 [Actinoplanes italicus]|uniref:Uncharacterized protein n=1 Tax=Actinoplanes italicus TaxID=113567 RepID=A0A2T0K335_9ACTN|nr:hypothetical protein [Actinoplanes italicus]PRX17264.1 hypothetical protein CLV67_11640 [Actinoplanes italicus]GIE35179.1 hypothetical protein Ait01nite_082240 [Actinoplanes italicus]
MIEELGAGEVLGHQALIPVGSRDPDGRPTVPVAGVRCGHPLVYPLADADLPGPWAARQRVAGCRYLGVLLAFDLDPLPEGRHYSAARFDVTLTGPGSRAVRLDEDGDSLGVTYEGEAASAVAVRTVAAVRARPGWLRRLTGRAGAPRAWVTGVQSATFGWAYDDPAGELLVPRNFGMHAVLEVPAGTTEVTGLISVQAEVSGGRGRQVGEVGEAVAFTEPVAPEQRPEPGGATVRLCMAADVAGYSRRRNDETERIQERLVELLSRARRVAGIGDAEVRPQPNGDGQFTVLPAGLDESVVIPLLLAELSAGLREVNTGAAPADRFRLRVALHRGLIKEGSNGWIGTAPIAVHRILDSPGLRRALAENTGAGYVLGVPDMLYRDVLVHGDGPPPPAELVAMTVDLPDKDFREQCWLWVEAGR